MTKLECALGLAKQGFHVFPLVPDSKLPLIKDYPNLATNDPAKINEWWDRDPNANIGISTTRYNGSGALLAVDVDNKNGVSGDGSLFQLELDGCFLPATATQHTPTGGKHLLYYSEVAVGQSASKIGEGLDIRSHGGYVVGAGSTLGGKAYTIEEGPLAPAPQWLVDKCGAPMPKHDTSSALGDLAVKRGTIYLKTDAPAGRQGNRNHNGFMVAARLKDLGISPDHCIALMTELWDCQPPAEYSAIEKLVENAFHYGKNPYGIESPEAVFTPVELPKTEFYLDEINKEYALLYEDGGHVIMKESKDLYGEAFVKMYPETTFNRIYSTKTILETQGEKVVCVTYSKKWLNWPGRREYEGLCFSPGREAPAGYYNLWRGFKVKPLAYDDASPEARQGFDDFLDHALTNVCAGVEEHFQWLMGYFAHMIQRPFEKPLTTLVFQGKKGTGKNVLIDRIGYLLGSRQYLVAHDSRYLTSNFNGHFDSCLMLVLDEAFWSGDKSAEGKLKGITTAPQILIERKGKEPYRVDNLVRLVVIGNEDWLVPASADERRYAVFLMGEGKMQNTGYFRKMVENMDSKGGAQVLLHYLKSFDLSTVNPNVAPVTEGLKLQKSESLNPAESWWQGRLMNASAEGWERVVDTVHLQDAYSAYVDRIKSNQWKLDPGKLGRQLHKFCPSIIKSTRRDGNSHVSVYKFPDLETARAEWTARLGHEIDWSK